MKRTCRFASKTGTVTCRLSPGRRLVLPVVPGILKHPTADALPSLLRHPDVARKYTAEALRIAAWPVLRQFPREWLRECLPHAGVRPARRKALEFLLS